MAKTPKHESFFSPIHSIFNPQTLQKKFKVSSLFLLSFLLLVLLSAITPLTTQIIDSYPALFISTLVGIPLLLIALYSVLFVFISAFEGKTPKYWTGFFLFLIYTFVFIIISNLLNLLNIAIGTQNASQVVSLLSVILVIIYLGVLCRNLKSYFKTTYPRVFSSLLIVSIALMILVYLQYLISNLQQF